MFSTLLSTIDAAIFAFLKPFAFLPWGWSLALSSLVFSVVFIFAFRYVSSQQKIKAARGSIKTALLETVVFRRDAWMCIRAQGSLFTGGLRYLGWAILPVCILMIPGMVLLSRMYIAMGVQPLNRGETFIVRGAVSDPANLQSLELIGGDGVKVGPIVRSPRDGSFVARAAVEAPANPTATHLTVKTGTTAPQDVPVLTSGSGAVPREILSKVKWESILLPAGQITLAKDGPVSSMWIEYPERVINLFGLKISWLVMFVILTLVWGYGAAKAFKIAI